MSPEVEEAEVQPETDAAAQPETDGSNEATWDGVAKRLGMDKSAELTPAALLDRLDERERERDAGLNRRFEEVAESKRELEEIKRNAQDDREAVARKLGELDARESQARARTADSDPTAFYELLGVDDPDEPITAKQLWNQQKSQYQYQTHAVQAMNETLGGFDQRLETVAAQSSTAIKTLSTAYVATEVASELDKWKHADEDKLLAVVATHEDSGTLGAALAQVAEDSHRSFLTSSREHTRETAVRREAKPRGVALGRGAGSPVTGEHPYKGKDGRVDWDRVAAYTQPEIVDQT